MTWLDWLFGSSADALRVSGEPQSANGASSFHLWWEIPPGERLTEIAATLEVIEAPSIERLVFWALQVSFVEPGGGGAHLGLQHHPTFRDAPPRIGADTHLQTRAVFLTAPHHLYRRRRTIRTLATSSGIRIRRTGS